MNTIEEIEQAVRQLSDRDRLLLAERLGAVLWESWDCQIERDSAAGKLNYLTQEVDEEIATGRTKPLDELLDHL